MTDDAPQFATKVSDLPWFVEVAKKSEAYLDSVYQTHPELLSQWYLEYREKKEQ